MNATLAIRKAFRIQRYRERFRAATDQRIHVRDRAALVAALNEQFSRQRYAADDHQWVTIGGSAEGGKKHAGGTPVRLDESGQITAGPPSLEGKSIHSLGKAPESEPDGDLFSDVKAADKAGAFTGRKSEPASDAIPKAQPARVGGIDAPSVKSMPDGRKVGLTLLRPDEMEADPARFQYKVSGIGDEGVTEELKEIERFRPEFAGQLLVWHDPKDGKTYVVNGHHRFELARRSGYDQPLPVYLIDVKDERGARAQGALANIAEGRGTAIDAAKFFRESDMTPDELKSEGVSMKGKTADEGLSLSKLSENSFTALVNDQLDEKRALAITRNVDDHDKQDEILRSVRRYEQAGRPMRDDAVEEMAIDAALTESVVEEQTDLFGTEEVKRSLAAERGVLKAAVKSELSREARAFTEVGCRGRAETLAEAGNVLDISGNQQRAQAAQQLLAQFVSDTKFKGGINDVINEFSNRLTKEPKREKELIRELVAQVRTILSQADSGREKASGPADGGDSAAREGYRKRTERAVFTLRESLTNMRFARQLAYGIEALRYAKGFVESEHPRDDEGQFTSNGSSAKPPAETEIINPSKSLADRFGDDAKQVPAKISEGRSQREINRWQEKLNKDGDKALQALSGYLASLIIGRDFNEQPDKYFERQGLTEFVKWSRTAKADLQKSAEDPTPRRKDGKPIWNQSNRGLQNRSLQVAMAAGHKNWKVSDLPNSAQEVLADKKIDRNLGLLPEDADQRIAKAFEDTPAAMRAGLVTVLRDRLDPWFYDWVPTPEGRTAKTETGDDRDQLQREMFHRIAGHLLRYGMLEHNATCFGGDCYVLDKPKPRQQDYAAGQWDESKHPRAADGKFGSGFGQAATAEPPSTPSTDAPQAHGEAQSQSADLSEIHRRYPPHNPDGHDTQSRYKRPDGSYTPERKRLHDSIIGKHLEGVTPSESPTVYMLGGGTASGKTSAIKSGLIKLPTNAAQVDPDAIKGELPEYAALTEARDVIASAFAHEESSDLSKQVIAAGLSSGVDVVVDTTGDNSLENLRAKIASWRKHGHRVVAHYATVPTEMAIERANARAAKTGRFVPPSVIRGIHGNVSRIVPQAIEEGLFDELNLYDTSTKDGKLIASAKGKQLTVHDESLWSAFVEKGQGSHVPI